MLHFVAFGAGYVFLSIWIATRKIVVFDILLYVHLHDFSMSLIEDRNTLGVRSEIFWLKSI